MTFEQHPWIHDPHQLEERKNELAEDGVSWFPMPYHRRPALISTGFDVLAGAVLARRTGARLFHGRASVAAAIAYLASRGRGAKFLNDADGPLSEEYADARVWRKGSLSHRLTAWAEDRAFTAANASAVLTRARANEVETAGHEAPLILPCCVDTRQFQPRQSAAASLRAELGLQGRILVYAGKFGGWYMVEEMVDFVAAFRRHCGAAGLLVLTTEDPTPFRTLTGTKGVPCVVRNVDRANMPLFLSSADAGLSFILPVPSKRACSPVKNGEYLACGLPVISTANIGDYSDLIARERVGVVIESLGQQGLDAGAVALERLLGEPGLADRCRKVAVEHVDLHDVLLPRYFDVYRRLLGSPAQHR